MGKMQKKFKAREKLVGREKGKRKGERSSATLALPIFLPFYFHVCAFSIQWTRLFRSLKQAKVQAIYKSCIGHLFFVTDIKPKFQASTSSKGFFSTNII